MASVTAMLLVLSACSATAQSTFEYHGIYSPTNTDPSFRHKYQTNDVESDWDLWGHSMKRILGKSADQTVYATINDTINKSQFCFGSKATYEQTMAYILDQFGEGTSDYSARICIMPQDNSLACTCKQCRSLGNTDGNATPAVTSMVTRLAKRFPRHRFYTSAYRSTSTVPSKPLPDNVSVLISASRLQHRVDFSNAKGYKEFCEHVEQWKRIAKNIYVWDYARNFNDYLTPYPCLHVMQSRLRLYRQLGISGIFVNGSGYDYSSFDDVQTAVLAQLMQDPDLDIDNAVSQYFKANYPVTAPLLTSYYLGLEHRTVQTNHHLPMYSEDMRELVDSYLNAKEFTEWRAQLDKASKKTEKPERDKLNYLLTALSYTQLQLLVDGYVEDNELKEEMKIVLQGHKELSGMKYYSEDGGDIDKYIKNTK